MKTIIFGGSFDPIHNGHIKLALTAKENLNADKVVFLIAKSPRWKNTSSSIEDRLNMLRLALEPYKDFEINTYELESNDEINYTYNTILNYSKSEDEKLYFLIGADQLEKLDKWYEIDKLSKMVTFVSFLRNGYNANIDNIKKYNVLVFNINISIMSSSSFRNCTNLDAPKLILDYVVEHNLYYINKIKSYIDGKRFFHSISVASLAYNIALNNDLEPHKAYLAGLLHDIGKYVPIEEQKEFIKNNYPDTYLEIQEPLYHQFMSVEIARKDFKIEDDEILNAIKYHATGIDNMSKLAKIIYASDKIDPLRGYDSSNLISSCIENIDLGFIEVLKENLLFYNKKGIHYRNNFTNKCIECYLKKE